MSMGGMGEKGALKTGRTAARSAAFQDAHLPFVKRARVTLGRERFHA